jgi:hypothetical protein
MVRRKLLHRAAQKASKMRLETSASIICLKFLGAQE